MEKTITKSPKQTKKLASDFAKKIKAGNNLALEGDLGSGKTTFIQGLAKALGVKEQITSPSFVLVKEFETSKKGVKLIHIDLYRLQKLDDIIKQGLKEYFGSKNITVVEWAKIAKDILPKNTIQIKFKHISDKKRQITIDK